MNEFKGNMQKLVEINGELSDLQKAEALEILGKGLRENNRNAIRRAVRHSFAGVDFDDVRSLARRFMFDESGAQYIPGHVYPEELANLRKKILKVYA